VDRGVGHLLLCPPTSSSTNTMASTGQLEAELTAMVHIEVVMPRKVCMKNEFFYFIVFCIKQDVQAHGEVIVEVV